MKRHLPIALLLASAAIFVYGTIQLVALRFEVGDVYPEYSSLRSDPLGTMVLYESIGNMDGLRTRRDFSTTNRLPAEFRTTYLQIATTVDAWQRVPDDMFHEIERFIREGGRLVVTLFPQSTKPRPLENFRKTEVDPEAEREKARAPSLWSRWNLSPDVIDLTASRDGAYEPVLAINQSASALPSSLEWHSGIVFRNLQSPWQPIYTRGADAVVIEQHLGQGSVVIATDSYFLSNEAMLRDRHADLLAWFLGSGTNVVFDEAHLGVVESPGVATLMRRYRLQWFVAALILLSGLFIWKSALSFVPRRAEETNAGHIAGKDSFAGFVNLLRRGIPTGGILAVAYAEWKKSVAQTGRYAGARLTKAEEAFSAENSRTGKDRNPVEAYQTIARILHKQNT